MISVMKVKLKEKDRGTVIREEDLSYAFDLYALPCDMIPYYLRRKGRVRALATSTNG